MALPYFPALIFTAAGIAVSFPNLIAHSRTKVKYHGSRKTPGIRRSSPRTWIASPSPERIGATLIYEVFEEDKPSYLPSYIVGGTSVWGDHRSPPQHRESFWLLPACVFSPCRAPFATPHILH